MQDHPRLAIGQIPSHPADLEGNLETMTEAVGRAKEHEAQIIAFPELALTGYLADKRFVDVAIGTDGEVMNRFRELSRDIDILLGFIEETPTSLFYNAAAYLRHGRLIHLHRKIYLPTYGPFDERRYYGAGWDVSAFDTDVARSAVLICGDAWHVPLPYMAAHDGADVIYVIAASSVEGLGETTSAERAWERMCRSYALTLSCYVVFVNFGGRQGDHHYWGGSFVVGPDGNLVAQSQTDEPDLVFADLDREALRQQRVKLPFRRDDSLQYTLQLGQRVLESKTMRDKYYADMPLDTPFSGGTTPFTPR
jgi:predicted amidohydrolase